MSQDIVLDIAEIMKCLPHRYPLLMVDKIVELVDGQRIVGVKNVTVNEPFFTGHFPGRPIMPGVLVLEAMAQVAAILALKSSDGVTPGKIVLLTGADDVRWKRQVVPGDVLRIEMVAHRKRRPLWSMKGNTTVDGQLVCSATINAYEVS